MTRVVDDTLGMIDPTKCTLEERYALIFNTLRKLESGMERTLKGYKPSIAPKYSQGNIANIFFAPCAQPETGQGLSFDTLRRANIARLPQFKNKHGQLAHSQPDGSDWSPAQWLQALVGELGEFANLRKKYERGDLTSEEYAVEAAKELADVQCYLDILARRCLDTPAGNGFRSVVHSTGIDLGAAVRDKFNEVSDRVGSSIKIVGNTVEDAGLVLGG